MGKGRGWTPTFNDMTFQEFPAFVSSYLAYFLGQFGTLIIGLIAALIAWRQYMVAHAKFKLDLFQKRYVIYEATAKLLGDISSGKVVGAAEVLAFRRSTGEAEFLFGKEILVFMNDVATLTVEAADWAKKLIDAIAAGDAALAEIATPAFRMKKIWQTRGSQTARCRRSLGNTWICRSGGDAMMVYASPMRERGKALPPHEVQTGPARMAI